MEEIARRGVVLVLAELARRESLTMEAFTKAAGLTESPARELRLFLIARGLVDVTEEPVRGATLLRIRLSPLGKEVASKLMEIEAILERAERRGRSSKSKGEV